MKTLLNRLLEAARRFTIFDFVMFKICLLFIGILLGTYFFNFFKQYLLFMWVIAVVAIIYMFIQTIRYFKR